MRCKKKNRQGLRQTNSIKREMEKQNTQTVDIIDYRQKKTCVQKQTKQTKTKHTQTEKAFIPSVAVGRSWVDVADPARDSAFQATTCTVLSGISHCCSALRAVAAAAGRPATGPTGVNLLPPPLPIPAVVAVAAVARMQREVFSFSAYLRWDENKSRMSHWIIGQRRN